MQISLILAALQTWAPVAVIVFVLAVYIVLSRLWPSASQRRNQVQRLDRWLIARQARSPRRLWLEIIVLAIGTALLVTLIDWWLTR